MSTPHLGNESIKSCCPFCGASGEDLTTDRRRLRFFVSCDGCGAEGPTATNEDDAIEAWKQRKTIISECVVMLKAMTNDDRIAVIDRFCHGCGSVNNECNCWNDE